MDNRPSTKKEEDDTDKKDKVKELKELKELKKLKKPKKARCAQCRKKVHLISFTCKCGKTFCMSHQSPHNHSCSYDYQRDRRIHIERTNPKVCPSTLVDPI